MTVQLADAKIRLEGVCPVEDAELLQRLLLEEPGTGVDWSSCTEAHSAVIQVLLATRREILGSPQSTFLREWIYPVFARNSTR